MSYSGKAPNGTIVLLIAILVLLAWFFFLKTDPCLTKKKLLNQRQEVAALFNRPVSAASDAELRAGFDCARSLKGVQR